jgi:hypothetical protein
MIENPRDDSWDGLPCPMGNMTLKSFQISGGKRILVDMAASAIFGRVQINSRPSPESPLSHRPACKEHRDART